MVVSLNTISTAQALATTTTMGDIVWLLNYGEKHPDDTLHYHARNMILYAARDVSHLCEKRARSQSGVHSSLADQIVENGDKLTILPTNNGSIHTLCQLINNVMFSVVEA